MKNNPSTIFNLALNNTVIRGCLDTWKTGQITWETCLECMYKYLVKEVVELNKKYEATEDVEYYCNFKSRERESSIPLNPMWNDAITLPTQTQHIESIARIAELWSRLKFCELRHASCSNTEPS